MPEPRTQERCYPDQINKGNDEVGGNQSDNRQELVFHDRHKLTFKFHGKLTKSYRKKITSTRKLCGIIRNMQSAKKLISSEPVALVQRAISLARKGQSLPIDEGPVGDLLLDALNEGWATWFDQKKGRVYLAGNVSWPGLYKIGCTRRSVASRMASLSGAGLPTPWVCIHSWEVFDAHAIEAAIHQACKEYRLKRELFHASVEELVSRIEHVIAEDRQKLSTFLPVMLNEKIH